MDITYINIGKKKKKAEGYYQRYSLFYKCNSYLTPEAKCFHTLPLPRLQEKSGEWLIPRIMTIIIYSGLTPVILFVRVHDHQAITIWLKVLPLPWTVAKSAQLSLE